MCEKKESFTFSFSDYEMVKQSVWAWQRFILDKQAGESNLFLKNSLTISLTQVSSLFGLLSLFDGENKEKVTMWLTLEQWNTITLSLENWRSRCDKLAEMERENYDRCILSDSYMRCCRVIGYVDSVIHLMESEDGRGG